MWTCMILAAVWGATANCVEPLVSPDDGTSGGGDPAIVALVTVEPIAATLAVAASQRFQATAMDGSGNELGGVSFTWSATGGAVDADGLFTAGNEIGSYEVVVTASSGHADTADVTITDAAPPPPPAGVDEPVFDPAVDTELWFDDFTSYASVEDNSPRMITGTSTREGKYAWRRDVGNVLNKSDYWSLGLSGGPSDLPYLRARYIPHPDGGGKNFNPGEMRPIAHVDGNRAPSVMIVTMWVRNIGDLYGGKKGVVLGGWGRTVMLVSGESKVNPQKIIECYWEADWPHPALDPTTTPDWQSRMWTWARDAADIDGLGTKVIIYGQNRGYSDIQFNNFNDGTWHRWTYRFTRGAGSTTHGDGKARIEMWQDGVKIIEWLGDDPSRPEHGLVFYPGINSSEKLFDVWRWWGPMRSANFGSRKSLYIDLANVRFWTPGT